MSQPKAVETPTLELIRSLQSKPYLQGFYLVGGTALALYLGHRKSVDIDLFSNFPFNVPELLEQIAQEFSYNLFYTSSNTLKGAIDNINVDILAHRYPLVSEPETIQEAKVISVPDIIAMKLNAISMSGQRSKDFIDIYYLLRHYKLSEMLTFYQKKYGQDNDSHILKSLIYFEEVDLADWPVMIKNPTLKWINIKKYIEKEVMNYTGNA